MGGYYLSLSYQSTLFYKSVDCVCSIDFSIIPSDDCYSFGS